MRELTFYGIAVLASLAVFGTAVLTNSGNETFNQNTGLKNFSSASEYREFISTQEQSPGYSSFGREATFDTLDRQSVGGAKSNVGRFSKTNVQEKGIEEPDILKTDGRNFYYSEEIPYYAYYSMERSIMPRMERSNISVISGVPPENMSEIGSINDNGEMLLENDTLMVLGRNITAYNTGTGEELWELGLESSVVTARNINGTAYIVTRDSPGSSCSVRPFTNGPEVACSSIFYFPGLGGEVSYTVSSLDMESGEITSQTSFMGSYGSNVYVSENSVYIATEERMSESKLMLNFFEADRGLLDEETRSRIDRVRGFDISDQSKMIELSNAIDSYRKSLDEDERKEFDKDLENTFGNYTNTRKRELSTTNIAEIEIDDNLRVDRSGEVPGTVNDQFSIDEKDGNLRITTTVGTGRRATSENDLYVLNEDMETIGSLKGMGINERIYSTRFIDDQAYIVTYRRIDPFHIVDLSDPESPELTGELKLPGFSSYLHPLDEDRILGVGEENNSLKTVIFDVSDPSQPEVLESKVIEKEYGSEVAYNHHAFLLDRKHEVFFIPGHEKGYVFSYSDGLKIEKDVELENPRRASYINDHMYIFGGREVLALNEKDWSEIGRLELYEEIEKEDKYPEPKPLP